MTSRRTLIIGLLAMLGVALVPPALAKGGERGGRSEWRDDDSRFRRDGSGRRDERDFRPRRDFEEQDARPRRRLSDEERRQLRRDIDDFGREFYLERRRR